MQQLYHSALSLKALELNISKEVASRHIPDHIINRPKKGFGIPITEWLAGDLKQPMLDLL